MAVGSPSIPPSTPPAGWYADPARAGRERWWTGNVWSDQSARPSRLNLFGPVFDRSMRPGMNRDARMAWRFQLSAVIGMVVVFAMLFWPTAIPAYFLTGLLGLVVIVFGLSVTALVFGIRGVRAASRVGGLGASIWSVWRSASIALLALLFGAIPVVVFFNAGR
jgi:hypothetical protein